MQPRCFLIANFSPLSSVWDMGRGIRTALEVSGVSVMEFLRSDFPQNDLHRMMLKYICETTAPRFVFDINGNENYRMGSGSLFDHYKLPRVSFITDSPLRHMKKIRAMSEFSVLGLVDGDFTEILKDFNVPTTGHFPMQHGGPPPDMRCAKNAERDIATLMIGNIGFPGDWIETAARHAKGDATCQAALIRARDQAMETDLSFYAMIKQAMPDAGLDQWLAATNDLEEHIIAQRRIDIVNALAGKGVVHCGLVDARVRPMLSGDIDARNMISFEDAMDLAGRAQVLINSSPSFRNGAHERLFYGIARGAHVVTEPTRFLPAGSAKNIGATIMPFASDGIPGSIEEARSRTDDDRTASQETYADLHTWNHRITEMTSVLRENYWDVT